MRHATLARIIGILLPLILIALPAAAQDAKGITAYRETIEIAADGSAAVSVDVTLSGWATDRIELPLNFAKVENFAVTAEGVKAAATASKTGDVRVIKVQFEGNPPAKLKLRVTFTAKDFFDWKKAKNPRGVYGFSYTFTNTTTANIADYSFKLLLPPGFEMNGVTSSTPRATGEEVEPPYDFVNEGGRTVVNLRSKSVGPGKAAAIAFGFAPEERRLWPAILIGLLVAALGLYLKRDVLTRSDYARESAA